ncbi:MAG: capsid assembly protein [Candidatus Puniceispirillaceae bacterium]
MTFLDLMTGTSRFCYAPADDEGGAGGGGSADDGGDAGDTGADDGGQDTGADDGASDGDDSGAGDDGDQGDGDDAGDKGKKKDGDNMLDALDDDEGVTFDFSGDEKPEGFPDEFWDEENNQPNAQALFDAMKKQEKRAEDLRAKMGKGAQKPPAKAEDYKLELPEELQELVPADDPLVAKARERAHKAGFSQEAFQGFMSEIIGDLAAQAEAMADPDSETNQAARAEYIKDEIKKIGPNGPQVLRSVESWAGELLAEGTFNEQDVQTLKEEGLVSAKMVQMFNRLRARMGGSEVPMDTIDDGLPPDSDIADMIDKAYQSKDAKKIREAEAMLDKRRAAGRPERLQI